MLLDWVDISIAPISHSQSHQQITIYSEGERKIYKRNW